VLTKSNGDVFSGNFQNNCPMGFTEIHFSSGDIYKGEVVRGVMTGEGFLQCTDQKSYKGQFENGKLHGDGTFFVEEGTYSLAGKYFEGVPERKATKYLLKVLSPSAEEEEIKGKKD